MFRVIGLILTVFYGTVAAALVLLPWQVVAIAAIILAALGFWLGWATGGRHSKVPPRIYTEPVDPVDLGAEIAAHRIARDLREWEATRPGRAA